MKKIFFILFSLMLVCNINAVDVNGSIHKEKTKTELTTLQVDVTIVLNSDFVYLSMEKREDFLEENKFVLNTDLYDELSLKNIDYKFENEFINHISNSIQTQKENLVLNKIKEYIPDFDVETEIKNPVKRLERVYHNPSNSEHFYLLHKNERIRLISFVKKPNPINLKPEEYSVGYSEHYY